MSIVFVYRDDKDAEKGDRDCIKYVEINEVGMFQCGHYFREFGLTGACFSTSLELKEIDFDAITSILTKEEFEALDLFNQEISKLKYGITEGDERYQKGLQLLKSIKPILEKLESKENEELLEKVLQDEREFLFTNYRLTDEDIDQILEFYDGEYKDRGIISYVFINKDEMAREEAASFGLVNDKNERFFDFEAYADELIDSGDRYFELTDGRIVILNY